VPGNNVNTALQGNDATCNVCGGSTFEPGPHNRLSSNQKLPRCAQCQSLERHRQLRYVYSQLPAHYLAGLDALQLSPDIGVDQSWFKSYELSRFESDNSLDIENIDRADASYDLVICNHVLEHVADDRQAMHELMRITRPAGFVQITVPTPHTQPTTVDWGYPKPEANDHYRSYGKDFLNLFNQVVPHAFVLQVDASDQATGAGGYVYLWTRDRTLVHQLRQWITNPVETA